MLLKYLVIQTKSLALIKQGKEGLKSLNPFLSHPGVQVKYLASYLSYHLYRAKKNP